jgi:hypothetical protein
MKKLIPTAALLHLAPLLASAQNADHHYLGEGYIFIGLGSGTDNPSFEHVGGGGEALLFKGLGVGGELGALGRPGEGVGAFSIGPSYHFRRTLHQSKIDPFVEGGYTGTFDGDVPTGADKLLNLAGGINYWLLRRMGVRLDFRDYIHHVSFPGGGAHTDQYWGIRVGLTIR